MSMGFAGTGYALYMDRLANQTMSVDRFERRFKRLYDSRKKDGQPLDYSSVQQLITEAFGLKFDGDKDKDPMVLRSSEKNELAAAFENDIRFLDGNQKETEKYDQARKKVLASTCRTILSHKCGIGWSSGAHTAMPVLTTAKGPGAERFSGFLENTDIANTIKSFWDKP